VRIRITISRKLALSAISHPSVVSVTPSNKIECAEKGIVPVQVIFCLKEKKPEEDQLAPLVQRVWTDPST
jgi:chitin synthase